MYILLVIEKPIDCINFNNFDHWTPFSVEIGNLVGKNPEIERLADNVLLIPINTGLTEFVTICSKANFPYKCLFLESIPEWVTPKK